MEGGDELHAKKMNETIHLTNYMKILCDWNLYLPIRL